MSKRYTYRRYKRTYPKQKWQMTVVNTPPLVVQIAGFPTDYFQAIHKNVCQTVVPTDASAASVVSANNIVKVGNFKFKGSIDTAANLQAVSVIIYLIFVPQGIEPDNNGVSMTNLATSLFYSHPEWVLCWTRKDMDQQGTNDFSMSSRLKRNLNSGDRIMVGALIMNQTGSQQTLDLRIYGTAAYYARAN